MTRKFQAKAKQQETSKQFWVQTRPAQILDLIEQTRQQVLSLDEIDRFSRAKAHLKQAMEYKNPRIDMFNKDTGTAYQLSYRIQTSFFWGLTIKVLSFIYMYLIMFDDSSWETASEILATGALSLFWIDLIMQVIHTSKDFARKQSKYTGILFLRFITLILLIIQIGIQWKNVTTSGGRPFNPFLIVRALLPVIYVSEVRRSFEALGSAYSSFLIFVIFQALVVIVFALIGSIIIDIPTDGSIVTDEFTNNYTDIAHMIFIIYVTGSYDAYPDNQMNSLNISQWFGGFFVLFVFLNMFLFSSIPGSLLFDKYIETRSKYILIDEIKMQHSLVLAFISIGDQNYQIDIKTIIRFFHYLYEDRVRYVDSITKLCLLLNDDGNCSVHVLEFIQLGRALQENPNLKTPLFSDSESWIHFRQWVNSLISLKKYLTGKLLPLVLAFIAFITSINALYFLYSSSSLSGTLNHVLAYINLLDIIIKLIGIGPEEYFNGDWNTLDFFLILSSWISDLSGFQELGALLKIVRIYQAFPLIKTCIQNSWIYIQLEMLDKFQNMISTVIVIMPIIARFLPLFMLFYYVLGVIGCEIFYDIARQTTTQQSVYDEFSNFKKFIYTQFYLVQVLTQAGWSAVAFDYAKRSQDKWGLTLLFFIFCHIIIVLVLAAVLKGIIWFVYISVSQLEEAEKRALKSETICNQSKKEQIKQFMQVEQALKEGVLTCYNSVIKRKLFEAKADSAFLDQLQRAGRNKCVVKSTKSINKTIYRKFQTDKKILQQKIFPSKTLESTKKNNFLFSIVEGILDDESIYNMEDIDKQDLAKYLKKMAKQFKIRNNYFDFQIKKNGIIQNIFKQRLFAPYSFNHEENQEKQISQTTIPVEEFNTQKALQFHVYSLHMILGIKTDRFTQKSKLLEELANGGLIDQCDSKALLGQRLSNGDFKVDEDCIVRKMYLEGTNQTLIGKFQTEYFSDIYGNQFKQTNKITIEPLIKVETSLTYALKKLARSPHINSIEYFKILSEIEGNISNRLLKKGSLFKFVYQLNHEKNAWFTIHCNALNQNIISFIKHGVWLYHDQLQQNQIYYAADIFKLKNMQNNKIQQGAEQIKRLFETFQTLALTLNNHDDFFESNPQYHKYDTYLNYIDVSKFERLVVRNQEISKIMVVMLTKQDERPPQQPLQYSISDIQINPPQDLIDFNLGETQSQTYKKLTRLCALDDDQITANQGLPFAFVLNFLCEISDTLKLYAPNFVHQAEIVLDHEISDKHIETQDDLSEIDLSP